MIIWLAQEAPFVSAEWDDEAQEHLFVGRKATVSFPTPAFLQKRLQLAEQLGIAGVAMWEAGQMLAAYIDLF